MKGAVKELEDGSALLAAAGGGGPGALAPRTSRREKSKKPAADGRPLEGDYLSDNEYARAIGHSSRPGEHVLDPFAGSGPTLIAAEQMSRRAFLMEIDPLYCDVIVQRWEQFTGRKAERIETAEANANAEGREAVQVPGLPDGA